MEHTAAIDSQPCGKCHGGIACDSEGREYECGCGVVAPVFTSADIDPDFPW